MLVALSICSIFTMRFLIIFFVRLLYCVTLLSFCQVSHLVSGYVCATDLAFLCYYFVFFERQKFLDKIKIKFQLFIFYFSRFFFSKKTKRLDKKKILGCQSHKKYNSRSRKKIVNHGPTFIKKQNMTQR